MARTSAFALALGLVAATSASAVQIDPLLLPDTALQAQKAPASLRLAEAAGVAPLATLRAASVGAADQLDAIAAWNRAGGRPAKDGFSRPLPLPKSVRFTADLLKRQPGSLAGGALLVPPSGGVVWGAEVRVENAHRLRLHLASVNLPPGTRLWVYGEEGTTAEATVAIEDVADPSGLWTPSVAGPAIRLEVRVPEKGVEGARFVVDRVLESFPLGSDGAPLLGSVTGKEDFSCAQDAACYNSSALASLDVYKKAVALLSFTDGVDDFLCTGGLMNSTNASATIPYLLTAHHCISSQALASTVEAFFDYIDATCGATAAPALDGLPRSIGATLLATGATSDFTLLRLASLPAGRGFLGSTSDPVATGTVLHRLSHPLGSSMGYSVTTVTASGPTCLNAARPNFLYSLRSLGAIFEGSSGSPVVRADGRVVGELTGSCGPTAQNDEGCDSANSVVDGALSQTWPSIAPFLAPTTGAPTTCVAGPTTLCLNGGRFQVQATFDTGSQSGQAQAVALTDDTGYFWFFDPTNVEIVTKVLNGCGLNQRFWTFAGGLTNVAVVLTVTDTKNSTVHTYSNQQGTAFQPIQDTGAFATCP
ncbi:MAG TPA: serine protease [Thermoanaerobaculia bacterium]